MGVVDNADVGGLGECIDNPNPEGRLGIGMGIATEGEWGGEEGVTGNTMGGRRVGDAGRLAKELEVGVLGVLDGLGPGSNGSVGKFLNTPPSLRLGSFDGGEVVVVVVPFVVREAFPSVDIDGTISHPPTSSSSSIDGKACENSVKYEDEVCGDDEGEDVGDGGPKLDKGTNACGDGVVDVEFDVDSAGGAGKFDEAAEVDTDMEGDNKLELEYRFRIASGDTGGVGKLVGGSRENRLLVAPTRPASWRDRIRSAMLPPPDLYSVPLVLGCL